ncbi:MAG: hypothetical protein ACPGUV_00115 [Polyangiales bacterium]
MRLLQCIGIDPGHSAVIRAGRQGKGRETIPQTRGRGGQNPEQGGQGERGGPDRGGDSPAASL